MKEETTGASVDPLRYCEHSGEVLVHALTETTGQHFIGLSSCFQQSLQSQSQSVENSFLHDSQLLHDKESLAEERRRLCQAKARFEDERKQLTEAAIRLGRQVWITFTQRWVSSVT